MSAKNARVSIEVTEKELAYLKAVTGYPYGNFPQLAHKLGDASQEMREAKRLKTREAKLARKTIRDEES